MSAQPSPNTPPPAEASGATLTDAEVLKVAALARLSLTAAQVAAAREQLAGVMALMDRVRGVDLASVAPWSTTREVATGPKGAHERHPPTPSPMWRPLTPQDLMQLAPTPHEATTRPPFILVPKVVGDGAGA
jgi:Asp-tRNA(Asn)/Glu-tRNA(Gln) amidotransferase C subunit